MRYSTDKNGGLLLGGVSATALAKEYGTPLYVIEKDKIVAAFKKYTSALKDHYGGNGLACYASKAFCCLEMCRLAKENGFGLDVVSHGELYTAFKSGFDMSRVCLHGNNKTVKELSAALDCGVGRIVVDNLTELKLLEGLCQRLGKQATVQLRIKPGIDAHTHAAVQTGQVDSKFGIAPEDAANVAKAALQSKNIRLAGLHCHIGSQIFSADSYRLAANIMIRLLAQIKEQTGTLLPQLNLGGGFGVGYTAEENDMDVGGAVREIAAAVTDACRFYSLEKPFLMLEPGRSIVAEAGTTLYTVGNIKQIPDVRTYVAVDGGMTDNPRYALYKSRYDMVLAQKAGQAKDTVVTIAGRCCESGDLLGENIPLQRAETGDILAVLCTGAYNFSMFTVYNRVARPPVVMVAGGKSQVIVKGDTLDDIIRSDV